MVSTKSHLLVVGGTLPLTATVVPENANIKAIGWSSSRPSVARIESGMVVAMGSGSTWIVATTLDGGKTDTCHLTVIPVSCNTNTPGWGESLGEITRGEERQISGNGITQIWSDAVSASACKKETFYSGESDGTSFNADCRSSNIYKGDLFSWCAVVRFQHELCPHPWRVPTMQDFINLDIALGGTGEGRRVSENAVSTELGWYTDVWGGAYGGYCENILGRIAADNRRAYYWSSAETEGNTTTTVRLLRFDEDGLINPQAWTHEHYYGRALRCVR
jgi:uncharacterized protein (TIGR02145 family)